MKTAAAIEAANRRFHRLSPAAKRVAIARDVLLCLRKGTIKAKLGRYFDLTGKTKCEWNQDLQPALTAPKATCSACAVGACFVAGARLGNDETLPGDHWEVGRHRAERYFNGKQLSLMEFTFERWRPCGSESQAGRGGVSPSDQVAAARLGRRYPKPQSRLAAIMRNVIANRGEFKP